MEYRQLGATGLELSVIGFGCNDIGGDLLGPRRAKIERTISRALDCGVTLFDTANSYTSGNSERLLGQVLRGRRGHVVLCSKAGHAFWGTLPFQRWLGPVRRQSRWNFRPRFLELAIVGSLRRLGTDYLDVFYLHNPPPSVVADDAVFERLDRLKQQGRIRHYGVSCGKHATSIDALGAIARNGVSVVQILTNVGEIVDLAVVGPAARQRGVGLIGRQPFAHGAVFSDPRLRVLLEACTGRSPAQAALRFALDLDGLDSLVVGMRTLNHLTENLGALDAPALSAAEVQALREITQVR